MIKIDGSEWTYKKEVGRKCYQIFDPSGKDVAWFECGLFVTHNDLRKHPDTYEFKSDIPQSYIDGLLAVKELIIANPENDNKISIIELNKKFIQDLKRLGDRIHKLYPNTEPESIINELWSRCHELSTEIEKL